MLKIVIRMYNLLRSASSAGCAGAIQCFTYAFCCFLVSKPVFPAVSSRLALLMTVRHSLHFFCSIRCKKEDYGHTGKKLPTYKCCPAEKNFRDFPKHK